jgi:hypothetical protein
MPIPKSLQRKKKKARPLPRAVYLPPEFERGVAMMAGAAAALGAANAQIADETASAFIAIDRGRGGLARPVSAKVAMLDYGPELQAAMGTSLDASRLGRGHLFRAAPAYDAAAGSVVLTPDLTLLHTKTWRDLHRPSLTRRLLL